MASRGVTLQVTGLLAAIATAAVIGWLLQQTILIPPQLDIRTIPQVAERTSPSVLSLFLALGSGLAGAISIMRGSGSTLVGVAIAVALVPPAATSGLGIAWGLPTVAIAAAVLVGVNLLAINLSALVLFFLAGFRPLESETFEGVKASVVSRIVVIAVGIAVLSIVLVAVTWASFQTVALEQQVQQEMQLAFDEADVEGVELVGVAVDYEPADLLLGNQPQVDVLVGIPRDLEAPPDLAQQFDDLLTDRLGRDFVVRVGFIEAQFSESEEPDRPFGWPSVSVVPAGRPNFPRHWTA
jgi:uncharacterized membrane protein